MTSVLRKLTNCFPAPLAPRHARESCPPCANSSAGEQRDSPVAVASLTCAARLQEHSATGSHDIPIFEMLEFSTSAASPTPKIALPTIKPLGQGGVRDTVRDYYYHYVRYRPTKV